MEQTGILVEEPGEYLGGHLDATHSLSMPERSTSPSVKGSRSTEVTSPNEGFRQMKKEPIGIRISYEKDLLLAARLLSLSGSLAQALAALHFAHEISTLVLGASSDEREPTRGKALKGSLEKGPLIRGDEAVS